jgi:nitrogen-specific signal transduction histidine kinase
MEPNKTQQSSDLAGQLENLRIGIREVAHEINNPLGIIRMAVYFLQTTNPEGEKREHYFRIVEEGLQRIEHNLQLLKSLRENPSIRVHEQPPKDHKL